MCVECDLAEPESQASLGGSAPGLVDGILSIPSSREWGAITHDSPYTRFEPIPSSREWGTIPQGQEIP